MRNLYSSLGFACYLAGALACSTTGKTDDGEALDSVHGGAHSTITPDAATLSLDGEVMFVPCSDDIPAFGLGLEAEGKDGLIDARLVEADPAPPEKFLNDWVVEFVDDAGAPIPEAELVSARPFMPVHGHDGTFPPTITTLDAPARFAVDRLNMWMRGPWQVQLTARSGAMTDYIVFNVCIED